MNNTQDYITIFLYEILIFGIMLFLHTVGLTTTYNIYHQIIENFISYLIGKFFFSCIVGAFVSTMSVLVWALLKTMMENSISYKKVFKTQFTICLIFSLIIVMMQVFMILQNSELYQTEP